MDVSEMSRVPPPFGEAPTVAMVPVTPVGSAGDPPPAGSAGAPATAAPYQHCDECGSPVDAAQRYCVACGAHRRHVDDPAARYLGQTTSRSRTSPAAAAGGSRSARAARSRGLGTALILALIPVAAAVGVLVGRSSNNDDAQLIRELAHRQAVVQSAATTTAPTAATTAAARTSTAGARDRGKVKHVHRSASTNGTGKGNSTTQYGSVSQITSTKPSQAQEQQGAQETQKVQKSTGSDYVNGQSNLPGTVVVP